MAAEYSEGIRPLSLGLTWTLTALAIIAVAARFVVRRATAKTWSVDDWIMALAMVLQIVYQATFTVLCDWGNGRPYDQLTRQQQQQISKWGYISAIPSIMISFVARISITILLVRIFGIHKWFKWYCIIFTSILTLVGVLSLIFLGAQSDPWEGLWVPTMPAKRWNPKIYQYTALSAQFLNAISDLTYVFIPSYFIWNLNMRRRQKNALVFVMALSLVTMCVVVAKISLVFVRLGDTSTNLSTTLARYFQSLVHLVANVEQCLVITLGCVPSLRLARLPKVPSVNDVSTWWHSLLRVRSSRSGSHHSSRSRQTSNGDVELEEQRLKGTSEESDRIVEGRIMQRKDFTVESSPPRPAHVRDI
ncbi:hypothetical protein PG995_006781 [Apiospora arundinis]